MLSLWFFFLLLLFACCFAFCLLGFVFLICFGFYLSVCFLFFCLCVCFCLFGFVFIICVGLCLFSVCFLLAMPHDFRVLVPRPGVRSEPLWWERQVQATRLTENFRPQGILIGVSSPRGPHLSTKTWLHPTACKLQCRKPQAKLPAKQEHSSTHQQKWDNRKICYRWRSRVKIHKTK